MDRKNMTTFEFHLKKRLCKKNRQHFIKLLTG
ncbi:MAG: hypothetical protein ACJA13_001820 [Paraglaciecola sp.]